MFLEHILIIIAILIGIVLFIFSSLLFIVYLKTDKISPIEIRDSNFIITGGSEGLGLSMAIDLVKGGANVVIISRTKKKLEEAIQELNNHRIHLDQIIEYSVGDVSSFESINSAIKKSIEFLKYKVDVMISNVGITYPVIFDQTELKWFEELMKVNYLGTVYTVKSVIPTFKKQKRGRIICVSSLVGLFGLIGYSCYSPTKAAIRNFCESLHQEYYADGISFSVAFPGSIGSRNFYETEQKIKSEETLEFEKLDTVLKPEEVSKNILRSLKKWSFLVSASGLNSDLLLIGSGGMSPASFSEIILQILFAGWVRLVGYILIPASAKKISITARKRRKDFE